MKTRCRLDHDANGHLSCRPDQAAGNWAFHVMRAPWSCPPRRRFGTCRWGSSAPNRLGWLAGSERDVFLASLAEHHEDAGRGARVPPSLFGEDFHATAAGNRYGLPPFYALHAWVWRHTMMFADWNPTVSCANA
jgi:hypothetical protein